MIIKNIHRLISPSRIFRLLLTLAFIVQLAIIAYNHYSGFYHVDGIPDFINRIVYSTVLSLIACYLIAYPDLAIILLLNKKFPWKKKAVLRSLVEFSFILLIALAGGSFITFLADAIDAYAEPFYEVLLANILIIGVVNLILMAILEGWIFFTEGKRAEQKAEALESELSAIKFEVLKSQINPHFMFNSLNVLSSLINKDKRKAQDFIDEFSMVYRYVLETIEKPVVEIKNELDFIRSYMFLQQIRYGENLDYSIDLPSEVMNAFIPPLSLQTVVENAIKHNSISSGHPLHISITLEDPYLVVRNNLRAKVSGSRSTGIGQENLAKRYAILGNYVPLFSVKTEHYEARLPIIF